MLRTCQHSGCATLTIGTFCVVHEPPVEAQTFPRGRPFPSLRPARPDPIVAPDSIVVTVKPDEARLSPTGAVSLGGGSAG
jgi:hypothetical protein